MMDRNNALLIGSAAGNCDPASHVREKQDQHDAIGCDRDLTRCLERSRLPLAGHLSDGRIESVPDVDQCDLGSL
jgi:hypothetical protein